MSHKPFVVRLRENLLLGLLSLAPIAVTLWVLITVIRFLDNLIFSLLPESAAPQHLLGVYIPGLGIVVTFFLILGAGILARTVTGKIFQSASDSFIGHVPVVRSLYKVAKQMSTVVFSQEPAAAFKQVVYVPFPSAQTRCLAFVTGHQPAKSETIVYVPTAPNPTSGYVIVFKDKDIENTDLHVDEALKIILSCGAVGKDE